MTLPRACIIGAGSSGIAAAKALHERAHHHCFMANSVNFPVRNEPEIVEE